MFEKCLIRNMSLDLGRIIILLVFLACATIYIIFVFSCLFSLINLYSAVVYLIMGVT